MMMMMIAKGIDTKVGAGSGGIWPVGPAPGRLQKSSPIPMA